MKQPQTRRLNMIKLTFIRVVQPVGTRQAGTCCREGYYGLSVPPRGQDHTRQPLIWQQQRAAFPPTSQELGKWEFPTGNLRCFRQRSRLVTWFLGNLAQVPQHPWKMREFLDGRGLKLEQK